MDKSNYSFADDHDFVLVKSVSKYMKRLRSYTMPVIELQRLYGISGYGTVSKNTELWMLKTDFEYYNTHAVGQIKLESVGPIDVVVPEPVKVVVAVDEVEEVALFEPVVKQEQVDTETTGEDNVTSLDVIQKVIIPDDLTKVKGIGPATAKLLHSAGVDTYSDLETMTYESWAAVDTFATKEKFYKVISSSKSLTNA